MTQIIKIITQIFIFSLMVSISVISILITVIKDV